MSDPLAAPTWLTAVFTGILAVGAIVTAVFAFLAFRKQSAEVSLLQEQALRDAAARHRAQATQVFTWPGQAALYEDDDIQDAAFVRNTSSQPVYDVSIGWADAAQASVPILMPGQEHCVRGAGTTTAAGTHVAAVISTTLPPTSPSTCRWSRSSCRCRRQTGSAVTMTGSAVSQPPWSNAAGTVLTTIWQGVRQLEAQMRADAGLPEYKRGGSVGNTYAAIRAVTDLGATAPRAIAAAAARQASGMVACFLPGCADADGNRPLGRVDFSRVTGEIVLAPSDGLTHGGHSSAPDVHRPGRLAR